MTTNVLVPVVAAALTLTGSVWIATYNNRKAAERVAQEANRPQKVDAYRKFMDVLVKTMAAVKRGQDPQPALVKVFTEMTSDIVVYGNPEVIMAFEAWRENSDNPKLALQKTDDFLRAIRSDLGQSNRGIPRGSLLGLFVIGGRSALQNATQTDTRGP